MLTKLVIFNAQTGRIAGRVIGSAAFAHQRAERKCRDLDARHFGSEFIYDDACSHGEPESRCTQEHLADRVARVRHERELAAQWATVTDGEQAMAEMGALR